jgi:hypothetical protein
MVITNGKMNCGQHRFRHRMRNPFPSSGQNAQLVRWWVLVHAGQIQTEQQPENTKDQKWQVFTCRVTAKEQGQRPKLRGTLIPVIPCGYRIS